MSEGGTLYRKREALAWCGGFLSVMGSFSYMRGGRKGSIPKYYLSLSIRRRGSKEPLTKLRRVLGIEAPVKRHSTGMGDAWNIRITGNKLELAMEQVWEYLTEERQQEYLNLEGEVLRMNKELGHK